MCNQRRFQAIVCGVVAMLFSMAFAQTPPTASGDDAFTSVYQTLNDAADRALTAALADRPWMKEPKALPIADGRSSQRPADSVTRVRAAVARVKSLLPVIAPVLREHGLPESIAAVMLVESGGNVAAALSPKGARGPWQFMPDTARRYGLIVSGTRDERLDVVKSTHSAARYLADLRQQFGSWEMALAAYNAGEQAVSRAVERGGGRDFQRTMSYLPLETREYVPAVLSAAVLFGGPLPGQEQSGAKLRILYADTNSIIHKQGN